MAEIPRNTKHSPTPNSIQNPSPNSSTTFIFLNFSDPANSYRLENGDNPGMTLVADLLTTDNYATWSRAMCRALRAKNKLGFINGAIPKPTNTEDLLFEAWERCNDMVVFWIQNSISSTLKSSVVFVDDASEIWMELLE
ncbi:uncharacterized protein LOC103695571 [Phoenix dactylifera]|uniref:Uncharacterized protein LOC103695571 n=1 Tax=Phoenix dactylifera TaxID=42345 RepID=A0A8B7BF10_PHODC|nr:uncharacterized protein LOC103695571 [Phoenix dactylifera]